MKKILVLILVLAVGLCHCNRSGARGGRHSRGMNLLLVTLDTVRADRFGCYGDQRAVTPVIDGLAAKGVRFENCYTPVPLTLPAHCSLFTGLWPIRHGVRNNAFYRLADDHVTLAESLKERGYDTAALVATYVLTAQFGLDQGFSLYDDRLVYGEGLHSYDAEIPADKVYDKFGRWLLRQKEKPTAPFFLWVHFYDPHKPYAPPAEYLNRLGGDPYRGEIAYVDHYLGRMIDDLRDQRLLENTILVIVGDHGEAFGEHQESGHGIFCYQESVRVPLLFYAPRLWPKPAIVASRVRLVDLMPTLLDLLGKETLADAVQGKSVTGLLGGKSEPAPLPVYLESLYGQEQNNWAPLTGLISGNEKYLSLPQAELYDLVADPLEKNNLFHKKNARARELDRELAALITRISVGGGSPASAGPLTSADRRKLESLGYVSSFARSGKAGLDPKAGIVYQNRIVGMMERLDRGELDRVEGEALALLKETAELKFPYARQVLNFVYEKKKNWPALERNLRLGIEESASNPAQAEPFRGNLLEFLFRNGRLAEAAQQADALLRFNPGHGRAWELRGQIAERSGQWADAARFYRQALAVESGSTSLRLRLAKALIQLGDHAAALQEIETLLAESPDAADAEILFTAAMLSVEAGHLPRAEELLRRIIEIAPSPRRYFDHALVLAKLGRRQEAVAEIEQALRLSPSDLTAEEQREARRALQRWQGHGD